MTKDPRVYLAHILERADRIEDYLRDGEGVFMRDTKTQDAVIRRGFGMLRMRLLRAIDS